MSDLQKIIAEVISPVAGANSPDRGERETRASQGFSPLSPVSPLATAHVEKLPDEVEQRLVRLLALGAIDEQDAECVRRRWHAYPIEWAFLLDCCEQAVTAIGPTTKTAARQTRIHVKGRTQDDQD